MNIPKTITNKGKTTIIRISSHDMGSAFTKHLTTRAHEHIRLIMTCEKTAPKTADIAITLKGKNSSASIVWAWRGTDAMRSAITISLVHAAQHTASSVHFKAACEDTARITFNALAQVKKNARNATTCINAHALMLSPSAIAFLKPDLEVETDDAQARHGASVGKPSDAELFYLTSRGFSEKESIPLLREAFFHDIVSLA